MKLRAHPELLDAAFSQASDVTGIPIRYPGAPWPDRGVLLELGACGGALPNADHDVQSIAAPIAQAVRCSRSIRVLAGPGATLGKLGQRSASE